MDERLSSEIRAILNEFDTIKNSLAPIISEVKKMQEMRIELKHFKEEVDSKLKKYDFEIRRLSQKEPPLKEVVGVKEKLDNLVSQVEFLRKQVLDMQRKTDTSKEIEQKVKDAISKISVANINEKALREEINKLKSENKRAISLLKSQIDEIDKKHTTLTSTTREKTAALITEADTLSKKVQESLEKNLQTLKSISEFENWFKQSERTLLANDEMLKSRVNQILPEIENSKKEIYSLKKEFEKISKKIEDFGVITSKLEKKQTSELSEMKGRLYDFEKKAAMKYEIEKIQNNMLNQLKNEALKIDSKYKSDIESTKKSISQFSNELKDVQSKVTGYQNEISKIKTEFNNLLQDLRNANKDIESRYYNDIESARNSISQIDSKLKEFQSKVWAEIENIKKIAFTSPDQIKDLKEKINSLSIKVENISKVIEELDKVL